MSPPPTMQRISRADWTLMTAIHDALRRDLDQLLNITASHASARARWRAFRHQLRLHLAAEHAAMWPRVRAQLAGDPPGQALLDAMDDEQRLLGPLQVVIDAPSVPGGNTFRTGESARPRASGQAQQTPANIRRSERNLETSVHSVC